MSTFHHTAQSNRHILSAASLAPYCSERVNQYVSISRQTGALFVEARHCKPSANGAALLMAVITSCTDLRYTLSNS